METKTVLILQISYGKQEYVDAKEFAMKDIGESMSSFVLAYLREDQRPRLVVCQKTYLKALTPEDIKSFLQIEEVDGTT